jgi:hypothetical protein
MARRVIQHFRGRLERPRERFERFASQKDDMHQAHDGRSREGAT